MDNSIQINDFFVNCFYSILKEEELRLNMCAPDLSLNEVHILDHITNSVASGKNTSSHLSTVLKITISSVTTAINALIKKGYVTKVQDATDKRVFRLFCTLKATKIIAAHTDFHNKLTTAVTQSIATPDEQKFLISALIKITEFIKG